MNEDLYETGEPESKPAPQEKQPDTEQEQQGKTFLVNKEMLPADAKPGDTWQMKVVRIHDDDAECMVVKDGEAQEQEGGMEPEPEGAPAGGDSMYE